jgi:hypothetical protein
MERRRCLRGRIVDLLTRADDLETRRDLLSGALHTLRQLGADRATYYSSDESLARLLVELGFTPMKTSVPIWALGLKTPSFYSTIGDGDAD